MDAIIWLRSEERRVAGSELQYRARIWLDLVLLLQWEDKCPEYCYSALIREQGNVQ